MSDDVQIGDVVSFGPHGSMPTELVGKYFRVEAQEGEPGQVCGWKLSRPYTDPACRQPYHSESGLAYLAARQKGA